MVEIRWMTSALQNLKEIVEYISRDSEFYANLFKERIFEIVSHLKKFPFLGRKVPEYQDEKIREVIYKTYRIIYRITECNDIEILTIHHGKRLLK